MNVSTCSKSVSVKSVSFCSMVFIFISILVINAIEQKNSVCFSDFSSFLLKYKTFLRLWQEDCSISWSIRNILRVVFFIFRAQNVSSWNLRTFLGSSFPETYVSLVTWNKNKVFGISFSWNIKKTLTVCSCHVTYAFESESTLYSCLNVKWLQLDSNPVAVNFI